MEKEVQQGPITDVLVAVYHTLLRYWISRGVSKEKAEDLAQEGLLKCLCKANKWEGKASLKTFLVTVGKNAGRDFLRKEARQERIKQRAGQVVGSPEDDGL
jgi:RNA polymerase sigma factor (sigma-70 family)